MKKVVKHEIKVSDLEGLDRTIPIAVQIRMKLNEEGFKFEDDGKLSSIINQNPIPLFPLKTWEDAQTLTVHFEQTIISDE